MFVFVSKIKTSSAVWRLSTYVMDVVGVDGERKTQAPMSNDKMILIIFMFTLLQTTRSWV